MNIIRDAFRNINKKEFYSWLSLLILLVSLEIAATISLPLAREMLYNGIQIKVVADFLHGLMVLGVVLGLYCVCRGFEYYVCRRVGLTIRNSLTKILKDKWKTKLTDCATYDNPDQRIAQDSELFASNVMIVLSEVVIAAVILIGLLIQMHENWVLLIAVSVYTVIAMVLVTFFHRPLIDTEKGLQRSEASFRFKLATIAHTGENVPTGTEYGSVQTSYLRFIKVLMTFTLFGEFKNNLMAIVPFLILVPMFFADSITFGEVMKGVSQFELVVLNATILISVYPMITKVLASYERISEFYKGLNGSKAAGQKPA